MVDVLVWRAFIDLVAARAHLTAADSVSRGPRATVAEIARRKGRSPMGMFLQSCRWRDRPRCQMR
jgi:hypothetical protein